jgi:hypothetical protein
MCHKGPYSRFLTTPLLPYSTSPALFRQSQGVFVIHLETGTLSSSCTTCITSVLDAACTSMLNVARVVLTVPVCFVIPVDGTLGAAIPVSQHSLFRTTWHVETRHRSREYHAQRNNESCTDTRFGLNLETLSYPRRVR